MLLKAASFIFALVFARAAALAAPAPEPPASAPEAPKTAPEAAKHKTLQVGPDSFLLFARAESDAYDVILTLQPKQADEAVKDTQVVFAVKDADNLYRLRLSGTRLALAVRLAGQERVLAQNDIPAPAAGREITLRLSRRLRSLAVAVGEHECLRTFDISLLPGEVGISLKGQALRLTRWSVRGVPSPQFADDFMRAEKDVNQWETLQGLWKLRTVREGTTVHPEQHGRALEPARSANYFSYEGFAEHDGDWALCAAGDAAWQDYVSEVSACSRGGAVGLAVGVRGADAFLLLRWHLFSVRVQPSPAELVRVEGGKETILARVSVPGAVQQWYRLGLATDGSRLIARIDGHVVMDLSLPPGTPMSGRVGLYTGAVQGAVFDDVVVTSNDTIRFDTARSLALSAPEGSWARVPVPGLDLPNGTPRLALRCDTAGRARYWLADAPWPAYVLETEVTCPSPANRVALINQRPPGQASLALECAPATGGAGTARLVARRNEGETELARASLAFSPGRSVVLALDSTEVGSVRAYADGRLLFRVADPSAGPGRPGLESSGGLGAGFAHVLVRFHYTTDTSLKVRTRLFARDGYMVGWASPEGAWGLGSEGSDIHWHNSDFFGPFFLLCPVRSGTVIYFATTETEPNSGYVATLSGPKDKVALTIRRGDRVLVQAPVPAVPDDADDNTSSLVLAREGDTVWCFRGEKDICSFSEADPPRGTRIGLKLPDADLSRVQVTQYNVKDYLFTQAPDDWHTAGTWEVTSRFACDPRWSWLSATAWDGAAVGWNKFEFEGDLTLEFYAGMRMQTNRGSNYPRPGEINATICGDGKNLNSGYSIIINGWDKFWTGKWSRLYRGDRQVACAQRELVPSNREYNPTRRVIPVSWDPGGRPIHGAWYYIKMRKIGRRIEVYFDNVLVMAYEDPDPLQGRRVAIWTMDNSIMIARVRMAYTRRRPAPLDVEKLDAAAPLQLPKAPAEGPTVRSLTHPGAVCTFEESLDGWQTTDGDQGADLSLDSNAAEGKGCLKLVNINGGGNFGAHLPAPSLDVSAVSELSFRYRIPPEVRVNLYLKINGVEHFVRITGPEDHDDNLVLLGAIPGARADGQWQAATFDLAGAARRLNPEAPRLTCEQIRIGYHHPGYGLAGFDGNPQGAAYWIDDFRLVTAGGPRATFTLGSHLEAPPEYTFSLTPGEPGEPDDIPDGRDTIHTATAPADGLYYYNARTRTPGGTWGLTSHLPFRVDTEPLRVLSARPVEGPEWGGGPVEVAFAPFPGCSLDLARLKLSVDGNPVAPKPGVFQMDWDRRALRIDLSRTGLQFSDGRRVPFALQSTKRISSSEADVQPPQPFSWELVYRRSADKTPPSAPALLRYPLHLTFEEGPDGVKPAHESQTRLSADPPTGPDGSASLKVFNRLLAGNFSTRFFQGAAHAGKAPIFAFDYCLDPVIHVDWFLTIDDQQRALGLTDLPSSLQRLGAVPGVIADGRWHSAEVNVRRLAESAGAPATRYGLSAIDLYDAEYCANAPGASFHLDNVRLVPAQSSAAGLELEWAASDPGGIGGYACKWSAKPQDDPGTEVTAAAGKATFRGLPEGRMFFHLRARDNAGNWGPAAHYQFLIDNTAPTLKNPSGPQLAPSEEIELQYSETGAGIDPSTVKVQLVDSGAAAAAPYFRYDPERGVCRWNWIDQLSPSFGPVPDGAVRTFKVGDVSDFAGNICPGAAYRMVIRYDADKKPPDAPAVQMRNDGALLRCDFEKGNPLRPSMLESALLEIVERSTAKDHALKVASVAGKPFGVYLFGPNAQYDLQKHPWLCFDYRVPADVKIYLVADVGGAEVGIGLTAPPQGVSRTLPFARLTADNQWRHVDIPLGDLVSKALPGRNSYQVRNVLVRSLNLRQPGASFELDNVAILGPVSAPPGVTAQARDLTGVSGFACTVDDRPASTPEPKVNVAGDAWQPAGISGSGLLYLHVRACDGAGNWGPATHVPFVYRQPPSPPAGPSAAPPGLQAASPPSGRVPSPADKAPK